jgi:hypothetical protein
MRACLVAAACLVLLGAPSADAQSGAPSGALTQPPGAAGCANAAGKEGCASVPTIDTGAVAIAPDGSNVYVASTGLGRTGGT